MKYIFKYAIFCIFFSTIGCTTNSPEVVFENKSTATVDSVRISTNGNCNSLVLKNIPANNSKKGMIIFCPDDNQDGSYNVELFSKGQLLVEKKLGYYTNGGTLEKDFQITFEKDSLHWSRKK